MVMGTYIAVGLLVLLLALGGALVSQRRAYVRDAAAIGEKESKLAQLTAERLQREKVAREHESDAAVVRALAKRAKDFAGSTTSASSLQKASEIEGRSTVPRVDLAEFDLVADFDRAEVDLGLDDGMAVSLKNQELSESGPVSPSELRDIVGPLLNSISDKELLKVIKDVELKFGWSALDLNNAFFASSSGGSSASTEQFEIYNPLRQLEVSPFERSVLFTLRENSDLWVKATRDIGNATRSYEVPSLSKVVEVVVKKKLEDAGVKLLP